MAVLVLLVYLCVECAFALICDRRFLFENVHTDLECHIVDLFDTEILVFHGHFAASINEVAFS